MVDYWLYFKSKPIATEAAKEMRRLKLKARIRSPSKEDHEMANQVQAAQGRKVALPWLVIASGPVDKFNDTVKRLETIAAEHGGEYDGWDADAADAAKIRPDLWPAN